MIAFSDEYLRKFYGEEKYSTQFLEEALYNAVTMYPYVMNNFKKLIHEFAGEEEIPKTWQPLAIIRRGGNITQAAYFSEDIKTVIACMVEKYEPDEIALIMEMEGQGQFGGSTTIKQSKALVVVVTGKFKTISAVAKVDVDENGIYSVRNSWANAENLLHAGFKGLTTLLNNKELCHKLTKSVDIDEIIVDRDSL